MRRWLADELAEWGPHDEAERYRRIAPATARGNADLLFETGLKCGRFALDGGPSSPASRFGIPGPDALHRRFEREAIRLLGESIAAGFRDGARLRSEPPLGELRPMPEFRALLDDLVFPAEPFAGR
jgi:hypothetical protein